MRLTARLQRDGRTATGFVVPDRMALREGRKRP